MEEHKSVIMHLLSQVRLGMDLTKVSLLTVHGEGGSKLSSVCISLILK